MSDALSVAGQWDGQFAYPRNYEPEFFQASLFETDSLIGGTITERAHASTADSACFVSLVSGARQGRRVQFRKTYQTDRRNHVVLYEGTLNDEGDEIGGTWIISESWQGAFLMVRRRAGAQSQAIEVSEQIDCDV